SVQLLTQFLEEVDKQPIELRAETYGLDPGVAGFMLCGLGLWFLGYPDRAWDRARRGLAYAEESRHPLSLASALVHSTILELLCGNAEVAARLAARAEDVSTASGVALFRPLSRFVRGAARAQQGDVDTGLSEMLAALAEHRAVTGPHVTTMMLGFVAAANARIERWDEGLRRAEEGIALSETTSERVCVAELGQVKGDLLLGKWRAARGSKRAVVGRMVDAARECFQRALEIAQKQEARSLALRSAMSLARLPGRHAAALEARTRLRSLYASF